MATHGTDNDLDSRPAEVIPQLHSVVEAALALGVSRWTLYREAKRGNIRCVRIGDRMLFTAEDLRAFIASRRR